MKKRFTFVARTLLIRGSNGSHFYKAGFFHFRTQGLFSIRSAACLYRALRSAFPRVSGDVRSGKAGRFFVCHKTNITNYAYQHTHHKRSLDGSHCAISAQGANLPFYGKPSLRRAARRNERLYFFDRRNVRFRIFFKGGRAARKIQCGHEGVARRSHSIARGANAAKGAFQVTSKHFFTPLARLDNQAMV